MAAPVTHVREKLLFNKDWKFVIDDNPQFRNPSYEDTSWRLLDLPHDWSIEGEYDKSVGGTGGFFPVGVGWYRKTFVLPESMKEKQVIIQFDGIYMNSEVWINGKFLGRYPYGFTTFQYDLTEYIKSGKDGKNTIAVRVDNSMPGSTRWYTGSGIYRNVWLIATNFVHFNSYKGVFITTPEASVAKATVNVGYDFTVNFFSYQAVLTWKKNVYNKSGIEAKKLIIRSTIIDNKGNEIAHTETEKEYTNYQSGYLLSQQFEVEKPNLWSASTPTMYYLKSEIISDGKTIDDQITSFGIRKLEYIPNKGMFINGKSEKLNGVCLHQDAGSFGAAVPIEVWHYRFMKLKEMGCNAVRTSHHPFAPEFYDLCDSVGIYVMDEAFDEWTRGWPYNYTDNNQGKAPNGYHLYFNQWHETDIKAMLWRDRNHPSIVMYSIGNEVPDQLNSDGFQMARKLVAICHTEDITRPATSGCDQYMTATDNGFMDALDISGYNYIDRNFKDKMYEPEHNKRPEKLCVGTETSKNTQNFTAYRDFDFVIGSFIWTGIDYLGESGNGRGSGSGLIDIAGLEKPGYYLYKSYWSDKPVVHIAVQPKSDKQNRRMVSKWNWNANDSLTINVYSNCDEVELFLNNRSLGEKIIDKKTYSSIWPVIFKTGELKAVGYKSKKKVSEDVLKTALAANRIDAKCNKTTLIADGKDVSFIEISMVDKNGTLVTDYNDMVNVNVSGEGSLIGLDSGDLSYMGLFKTNIRKPYTGKLMVALRSTENPGLINIELKSEKTGTLKLQMKTVK